jgi:hypothetical protein
MNRVQVVSVSRRQSAVTPLIRSSSRCSAPNAFTVGLEDSESDSAPPIRLSRATDFRFAGRTYLAVRMRLEAT